MSGWLAMVLVERCASPVVWARVLGLFLLVLLGPGQAALAAVPKAGEDPAYEATLARLEQACADEDMHACIELADQIYDRLSAREDGRYYSSNAARDRIATAVNLYWSACGRDHLWGCYRFGVLLNHHSTELVLPTDWWKEIVQTPRAQVLDIFDRALLVLERACLESGVDGSVMQACTELGQLHLLARPAARLIAQDHGQAAEYFARACGGGHMKGCTHQGNLYTLGLGVQQDPDRADALYRQACDGGHETACHKLRYRVDIAPALTPENRQRLIEQHPATDELSDQIARAAIDDGALVQVEITGYDLRTQGQAFNGMGGADTVTARVRFGPAQGEPASIEVSARRTGSSICAPAEPERVVLLVDRLVREIAEHSDQLAVTTPMVEFPWPCRRH